ncbi:RdRP-domain-containing protein [Lentinus tigrinus ALCF2SS1-7]|uniref:RNA-dependent RNA polymerase n=1 Tax=Lentinus tigrinus ALCF2SS1-6 TaxID=1328759 RepID=A0A5C2SSR0_9APHY|nr:RdRP-domain-containing protein [Lentinus tigrinus ALCF2SS1-6]RPD80408.1 RdRP-domain-containing protein [Lentinus tigrinus ALCF2SS1-7]
MEIELADVSREATQWDVKRIFGAILHGEGFYDASDPKARPINFKVTLNPGQGVQNNGTGSLILPHRKVGDKLLKWVYEEHHPVLVNGRRARLFRTKNRPGRGLKEQLEKTPYLEPDVEEKREEKLRRLDLGLHVDKLQFGIFYRRPEAPMTAGRIFSNEYQVSHRDKGAGLLWFDYDHKVIRIQLGDRMTEEIGSTVAIKFDNLRKVAIGLDFGNPFVCFELLTPPMLERERFNRTLSGVDWKDQRKFRQRLDSLNEAHAVVAPYAHHLRIVLHTEADIRKFAELCQIADLKRPIWANVEAFDKGFFSPKQLYVFQTWMRQFSWPVAFQLEALVRSGLMHTEDLLVHFRQQIEKLSRSYPADAADILRHFSETLRTRDPKDTNMECFHRVLLEGGYGGKREKSYKSSAKKQKGLYDDAQPKDRDMGKFKCYHVTFTPTRMVLEGPYVSQSNRVIRQFAGYEDHFLRVDFRDEDRLQYRWAREVDGTTLLTERVGGILKKGFELGGRDFYFLAYSSSALREHAVWFMSPFQHPIRGWVTPQSIRDSLGDFTKVIKYPSKYAARLAQAFTATDPSVSITPDQWEKIEDLGTEPYLFTDGVGTISPKLGDMIWEALCNAKEDLKRLQIQPWAYQIRFLGFKGMVGIDPRLEGIKMRLRPSMDKFEALDTDSAEIEIARWFDKPGTCYLNRALVMILEDRGVEKEVFVKLQDRAVTNVVTAIDTIEQTVALLKTHNIGISFGLPWILKGLGAAGMGMCEEKALGSLKDTFLYSLIGYAQNHVLRDMKHSARIPIPDSYLLVGLADEGPAYELEGAENVYTLEKAEIFACIQEEGDEHPTYLKGPVIISRSPVVHPGDVQLVNAIGEPPADKICAFRDLKNVVVLPSVGDRSLASMLSGGDLDGDLYSIIKYHPLLPTEYAAPGDYTPVGTRARPDGQDSTVDDICDFIVEYINSDVLGLLSDRHLMIADQSSDGTNDPRCIELAQLCSQAVDYPKNGIPVDAHDSPRLLIRSKPDWKMAEDNDPRDTDYYLSSRALGDLFRAITINKPKAPAESFPDPEGPQVTQELPKREQPLSDVISTTLKPHVERQLHYFLNDDRNVADMRTVFLRYEQELRYICVTHALSDAPDIRLQEEEVAIGTILANCSQHRWRNDRMHRMRMHASELVRETKHRLYRPVDVLNPEQGELLYGLSQAWLAWDFGMRNKAVFGARSFSLVALGVVLDTLSRLGGLP